MLRTLLCAVVALLLAAGVGSAADTKDTKKGKAKKGKVVVGKFASCKEGTLCLMVKGKKKGAAAKKQEFEVADDTKVVDYTGGEKQERPAKDALKTVKPGAMVRVQLNADGKVVRVQVGTPKSSKKPKKDTFTKDKATKDKDTTKKDTATKDKDK